MRAKTALTTLAALAAAVGGCGGSDDPPAQTTVSVTLPSQTTSTTGDLTTTDATTITDDQADTGGGTGGGDDGAGGSGDDSSGGGGGGGGTTTPQPESGEGASTAILAATAVLTSQGTPEQACGTFVTENFIARSYGGEANCVAARAGQALASAIGVQSGGDTSTHLVVIPSGGPYGAARVSVDLVEDGGRFRVDALDAHVPAGP
jgi:hypothetical protein